MPDKMHTLDTAYPNFNGMESSEEKLEAIQNYLFMLMEELRYLLRHLDADNFNDAGLEELAERMAAAETDGSGGLKRLLAELLTDGLPNNAEACFDRLSTSRRVCRYILGDTSDDDYLLLRDRALRLVHASVAAGEGNGPATEQAVNRFGRGLYWQREPVSHNADGWPLDRQGTPILASTAVTAWPVTVYAYEEQVQAQLGFRQSGGERLPQLILGAGDAAGRDRGLICREEGALLLRYLTASGGNGDIRLSDFVDAKHRRLASCAVDRSLGTVSYTLEGEAQTHSLSFAVTGNTVRYTWPDGHLCEVSIE